MATIRIQCIFKAGETIYKAVPDVTAIDVPIPPDKVQDVVELLAYLQSKSDVVAPALTAIIGCIMAPSPPPKAP